MTTSFARDLPTGPDDWNVQDLGHEADEENEDRTVTSTYVINAENAQQAELRVLAYIHRTYDDCLCQAAASADSAAQAPGRWKVVIEWDTRPKYWSLTL